MKKSAKLSLTLALMMGITGGVQIMDTNQASAEVSDKARIEFNGVLGYIHDRQNLGVYSVNGNGSKDYEDYTNTYNRIQFNYYQSKTIKFQARLHSDYDSFGTDYGKTGSSGAYFDQYFLELKDPKAKVNYTLGKKGAYLGQGLIHNSTGNLTGVQVSFGNWYDPECLQLMFGRKKNGSNFLAANYTKDLSKAWQLSLTGIHHDTSATFYNEDADGEYEGGYYKKDKTETYYALNESTGKVEQKTRKVEGTFVPSGKNFTQRHYNELHLVSVGSKVKAKAFTVQGEYVYNLSDSVKNGSRKYSMRQGTKSASSNWIGSDSKSDRRAWYVEVFTGPTSDMTSGLPLQKPGTNVWSLKYQNVGCNAVDSHNPTFVDDASGVRLSYGHTFAKGLSADVAVARMKDKGGNSNYDPANGKWKNYVMAEVAYKFR